MGGTNCGLVSRAHAVVAEVERVRTGVRPGMRGPLDPLLQTLEVLRLDGGGYRIVGAWRAEAVVQCEPFEALPIRIADLWSA